MSAYSVSALLTGTGPAIRAPSRPPLSFAELRQHSDYVQKSLNEMGIGRNDPVAIVLPNGAEMALAFLTVAQAATSAPLNPAYKAEEFQFYLSDLDAKALIVDAEENGAVIDVAAKLGIKVIRLQAQPDRSVGLFELSTEEEAGVAAHAAQPGPAQAGDIALVLHTSGTTSKPKMVPLSQANLYHSAQNIRRTLELTAEDVCLNIMPLFHIHGLMAAVSASLCAGGSVYCTPGFNALKFFHWLEDARPTWYTAVPTMHQTILARASRQGGDAAAGAKLRFIRSSSASLAPAVLEQLEKTFNAPVVEAYAMTEASHQMCSNPLPPGKRKPGSVGPAAGPKVAIMDAGGVLLEAGEVGEVVISGANVTSGYANNPDANKDAFEQGWFRTGDQGRLDEDGYLWLTGRLKEIINRGGEKISPREIDEVLLSHPGVAEACTFALPHEKLGEEVAAIVVLREAGTDREAALSKELQDFVAKRLAPFKVPRKIFFMETIPKGPTGKIQRIGMAQRLGLE